MHCAMRYKLLQCSGVEPSSVPTARYDGMHEVRALVNNAYACKHRNALYRIMAVSGTFCMRGDNAHTSVHACMHTTHTRTHVCKCTPKSSRTSWIFHCLVEIPYPQPNIEIRKPSIELKFTLISVTICSLIFFICKVEEALFRP